VPFLKPSNILTTPGREALFPARGCDPGHAALPVCELLAGRNLLGIMEGVDGSSCPTPAHDGTGAMYLDLTVQAIGTFCFPSSTIDCWYRMSDSRAEPTVLWAMAVSNTDNEIRIKVDSSYGPGLLVSKKNVESLPIVFTNADVPAVGQGGECSDDFFGLQTGFCMYDNVTMTLDFA